MNAGLQERLQSLSEAVGVSGGEADIRALILPMINDYVSNITIDPMGNILAVRKGTGASSLRVMLSAPMDEAGFMISEVGDDGLVHVVTVGSHDERYLPAQRVMVGDARTPGVFQWIPIHMSAGRNDVSSADHLVIDVGADSKGGVKAKAGDRVALTGSYLALSATVVRGKAFESRAACAALVELLSGDPPPFDVYVAFTVQSHIGGRGAKIAANRLAPDAAIVLGGVEANDIPISPDDDDKSSVIRLGGGPVIRLRDSGFVPSRPLIEHIQAIAESQDIALQLDAQTAAHSDSASIGSVRLGVPAVTLGVPIRYLGSPNSLLNPADLTALIRVLRASLEALTAENLEQP